MGEEELENMVATLVYYSKGRFNPQWVESLSYRRRLFYMKWLRKQLIMEDKANKKMLGKI